MPIYDYRCSNCGHRAEILHGVHDESARVCPECGGQMRKAITAPAVVFKGSGWAKVDRRSSSHRKSAGDGEAASPAGATSGSEGSAGSESASSSESSTVSTTASTSESRSESRSGQREKSSKGAEPASGTKSKASSERD